MPASRIERAAERRADADALAALEHDAARARLCRSAARWWCCARRRRGLDPLFTLAEARALGADGRGRCSSGSSTARRALRSRSSRRRSRRSRRATTSTLTDLRSIAVRGLVDADHLPPLAEGKALLNWHARHRFCSELRRSRPRSSRPAGGAIARPARRSISRAPIRS